MEFFNEIRLSTNRCLRWVMGNVNAVVENFDFHFEWFRSFCWYLLGLSRFLSHLIFFLSLSNVWDECNMLLMDTFGFSDVIFLKNKSLKDSQSLYWIFGKILQTHWMAMKCFWKANNSSKIKYYNIHNNNDNWMGAYVKNYSIMRSTCLKHIWIQVFTKTMLKC